MPVIGLNQIQAPVGLRMYNYLDFEKPVADLEGKILELKKLAIREATRLVHFAALEKIVEDRERRWPRSDRNGCTSFSKGFGDREAKSAIVCNTGNKRPAASQINIEHRI